MSGGGGRHRAPIEMPKEDGPRGALELDRDSASLNPANADLSDYHPDGGMRSAVVHHVVTAFLIAMVLGIATWGYLAFKNVEAREKGSFALSAPLLEIAIGNAQLDRFRFALEVYFKLYEKYPPDLDALVDEGLLASSDLSHPPASFGATDSKIEYRRTGDTFELVVERTVVTTTERSATELEGEATEPATRGTTTGIEPGDETKE